MAWNLNHHRASNGVVWRAPLCLEDSCEIDPGSSQWIPGVNVLAVEAGGVDSIGWGHNIFLYHHSNPPGGPILCDFGVEVTRNFETAGDVFAAETPGAEAAVAVPRAVRSNEGGTRRN